VAIELRDVDFSYDGAKKVLDRFSISFPVRGAVCLSGPSGCGKTTLLRILAGLEKPQGGTISGLDGMRTAYVFQENRLLPWMSALDNAAIAAEGENGRNIAAGWLERFGLGDDLHKLPDELSGGMKQRISLARALAAPSDLLILDEPFAGLDALLWKSIATGIKNCCSDKLVILVTHMIDQAESLGADVLHLEGPPLRLKPSA
jgi:NitT/TauT family transport system ATP-binding protein